MVSRSLRNSTTTQVQDILLQLVLVISFTYTQHSQMFIDLIGTWELSGPLSVDNRYVDLIRLRLPWTGYYKSNRTYFIILGYPNAPVNGNRFMLHPRTCGIDEIIH